MRREEKQVIINRLTDQINSYAHFYLADTSELDAETTSILRRKCFDSEIELVVVKNTLLKIALDNVEKEINDELYGVLKGSTSLMLTNTGNSAGKLIKEFRKNHDKPILKGAYVDESIYIGDIEIDTLANIKSKEELIGDIVMLLQSPMKNVISALNSGGNIIAGVVKTLAERE